MKENLSWMVKCFKILVKWQKTIFQTALISNIWEIDVWLLHICRVQWYHQIWPWVTLKGQIQVTLFLKALRSVKGLGHVFLLITNRASNVRNAAALLDFTLSDLGRSRAKALILEVPVPQPGAVSTPRPFGNFSVHLRKVRKFKHRGNACRGLFVCFFYSSSSQRVGIVRIVYKYKLHFTYRQTYRHIQ